MMENKILVMGGGGHAKVILDCLGLAGGWKPGVVERTDYPGTQLLGNPVVGCDDDLERLFREGYRYAVIGFGSIGNTRGRRAIAERLQAIGFSFPVVIHPRAVVASSAEIGPGTVVFAGAVINPAVVIGCHCIINTTAVVEHDCRLGDFVHTAPGSKLAGTVTVGSDSHIGIGAIVRERATLGEGCLVGAGAVVLDDVEKNSLMIGIPARRIREHNPY